MQYFQDDEGTAAEGPYKRLLKLRKWLYLSSVLAGLNASGLIRPQELSAIAKDLVHLPPNLATAGIVAGLTLTSVQYGLLLMQLRTSYDIALEDRLAGTRQENLLKARTELEQARAAAGTAPERRAELIRQYQVALAEIPSDYRGYVTDALGTWLSKPLTVDMKTDRVISPPVEESARDSLAEYFAAKEAGPIDGRAWPTDERLDALAKAMVPAGKSRFALLQHEQRFQAELARLYQAETEHSRVVRSNPAERPGFMTYERLLDRLRIWPPVAAAAIAWGHLIYAGAWGLSQLL